MFDEQERIGLLTLDLANPLALNDSFAVPTKLDGLKTAIEIQPPEFNLEWSFDGSKHYIRNAQPLAYASGWLLTLFSALEDGSRGDVLMLISNAQAGKWSIE